MKAYHGVDGKVRLFRPKLNMNRLNKSADAASLPVNYTYNLLYTILYNVLYITLTNCAFMYMYIVLSDAILIVTRFIALLIV